MTVTQLHIMPTAADNHIKDNGRSVIKTVNCVRLFRHKVIIALTQVTVTSLLK